MTGNSEELLIDLLIKQATEGLSEAEQLQLSKLENGRSEDSVELTVSAISLINEQGTEPLPSHLRASLKVAAENFFDRQEARNEIPSAPSVETAERRSWFDGWLGWAVAAAACMVLAANIFLTRFQPNVARNVGVPTPTPTAQEPTMAEKRQELIQSAPDVIRASFGKGNVKEIADISGDIVWSDSKQAGYMVLRGLPVNDSSKQQYQLWIFDETQSDKTPIDGGVFDVNSQGEVIVPVTAKLKAKHPKLFAITMEKPGGVVVSDRTSIAALSKVET